MVLFAPGRLAQRESASFTPKRSLVRSQYRPLDIIASSHLISGVVIGVGIVVFRVVSQRIVSERIVDPLIEVSV
jgi:hypothetical protein